MNAALLVARLVLAAVFGASGTAKLFDRAGTRATATAFGVPAPLAGSVALALPAAELAVAAALIPASSGPRPPARRARAAGARPPWPLVPAGRLGERARGQHPGQVLPVGHAGAEVGDGAGALRGVCRRVRW